MVFKILPCLHQWPKTFCVLSISLRRWESWDSHLSVGNAVAVSAPYLCYSQVGPLNESILRVELERPPWYEQYCFSIHSFLVLVHKLVHYINSHFWGWSWAGHCFDILSLLHTVGQPLPYKWHSFDLVFAGASDPVFYTGFRSWTSWFEDPLSAFLMTNLPADCHRCRGHRSLKQAHFDQPLLSFMKTGTCCCNLQATFRLWQILGPLVILCTSTVLGVVFR